MSDERPTRDQATSILRAMTVEQREAIALLAETHEAVGDWHWNGEESIYEDSVSQTLNSLASFFRMRDTP